MLLVEQGEYGHAPLLEQEQGALKEFRVFMIKNIVPRVRIDIDPPGQACAESGKPDLDGSQ